MEKDTVSLVERSKAGDNTAFSQLYSDYCEDMFRFAVYMMGNTHDAEDAMQEAVFSAWKNIKGLKDPQAFKSWIFKILSNQCKTNLMKKNKFPDALPVEDYDFLISDSSSDYIESTTLLDALKKLTPPDGQIIVLSVIGGFKSHELAKIFNMEPSTVRSHQKRAIEQLKGVILSE